MVERERKKKLKWFLFFFMLENVERVRHARAFSSLFLFFSILFFASLLSNSIKKKKKRERARQMIFSILLFVFAKNSLGLFSRNAPLFNLSPLQSALSLSRLQSTLSPLQSTPSLHSSPLSPSLSPLHSVPHTDDDDDKMNRTWGKKKGFFVLMKNAAPKTRERKKKNMKNKNMIFYSFRVGVGENAR